ncbi:allantoate deiminase [Pullulanibacillus pueri]|uniref:Zn-dependent hydrolase n=1 Tax=Pullulanibacillus pueri TaxID=1437324 RepID=A0A8J3ELM2_9BACL|nr:M20 family metallo-hydrolase [Pullulanibacillus pueri]MBM7682105.1 allantoate deiminase [Pullulanibacillus pueri]GGH79961.1 Zn-dependent hydrolase [Pullulanibacillus pueri]
MDTQQTWNLYEKLMKDYDTSLDADGVSGKRLAQRLSALSEIGLTDEHGSYRIGFSQEEKQAKQLVKQWMNEAGLEVSEDGAGNVFGRLSGRNPHRPAILSGSHVDSVPNGGHFDGPLGVLAALEVVEAWKATGFVPESPYEVVIFTDEEGSRFNGGLTGSRAMTGEIDREAQQQLVDIHGDPFEKVIEKVGLSVNTFAASQREMSDIKGYVEIHIEQGKRLEKAGVPVGIVTGIAGPSWLEMTFTGDAGHAGNTPMDDRRDALLAASQFVVAVNALPQQVSSTAVATVGKLDVHPNGTNVIAGQVTLTVDIRDIDETQRDRLIELIIQSATSICEAHQIDLEWKETQHVKPVPIKESMQEKLSSAIQAKGIAPVYLTSGAAHDAMIMGHHVPVAMIFVQSKDGVSHNPAEWSSLNDCVQSAHVLKQFVETY